MSRDKFFVVDAEYTRLTAGRAPFLANHPYTTPGKNNRRLSRTATSIAKCSVLQNAKPHWNAVDSYLNEQLRVSRSTPLKL